MIYVGIYALIYLHTILGEGMDSRDGLPRGALPSGILENGKILSRPESSCLDFFILKLPTFNPNTIYFLSAL